MDGEEGRDGERSARGAAELAGQPVEQERDGNVEEEVDQVIANGVEPSHRIVEGIRGQDQGAVETATRIGCVFVLSGSGPVAGGEEGRELAEAFDQPIVDNDFEIVDG